ncbi:MAG: hypothetical protein M3Q36_02360 [bacterium]|nr:hypothetical protein [bacterium]
MTVTMNEDSVCVELHGREQFWALRAKVSVPLDTITDLRFEPIFQDWRKWQVRMPGTHAPTRLLAGSYWTEEGWDFLYVKRPVGFRIPRAENVLVIDTNQDRYKRIIISLDESESSGIIKWWNQAKTKPKKSVGKKASKAPATASKTSSRRK